jgi:hypothetical protein
MRLILPLLLLLIALPGAAFEAPAHIAICETAWQQVQPATRQWLKQVMAASPQKRFSSGCVWPDKVRKQSDMEHTKVWHYINVPRSATTVEPGDCPAQGCVTSAIRNMRERLLSNPDDWQALLFIGHLVADIHQPMHVSYADDRGGNRADIRFRGERTNLHALWDGDLTGSLRVADQVRALQPLPPVETGFHSDFPERWATGSLTLTRTIYADYQQRKNLDNRYAERFAPQLQQRMQLAAARLAALLDEIHEQVTKQPQSD